MEQPSKVEETWEFLEGPFVDTLYEGRDRRTVRNHNVRPDALGSSKGLPDDAHLISKPRLRVQKMKKDSCETKKILKEKFEDCYGSYDPTFENTENLEGVSGSG